MEGPTLPIILCIIIFHFFIFFVGHCHLIFRALIKIIHLSQHIYPTIFTPRLKIYITVLDFQISPNTGELDWIGFSKNGVKCFSKMGKMSQLEPSIVEKTN